jgi:hypothetical protein
VRNCQHASALPGRRRRKRKPSAPGENRTCDQRFRKPLLYPLSYGGETGRRMPQLRPSTKRGRSAGWWIGHSRPRYSAVRPALRRQNMGVASRGCATAARCRSTRRAPTARMCMARAMRVFTRAAATRPPRASSTTAGARARRWGPASAHAPRRTRTRRIPKAVFTCRDACRAVDVAAADRFDAYATCRAGACRAACKDP